MSKRKFDNVIKILNRIGACAILYYLWTMVPRFIIKQTQTEMVNDNALETVSWVHELNKQ